jgi:ribosomal-protein-alanine N-acetyltransferase
MPPAFRIRHLRPSDLDSVLEIERSSFGRDAYDRNLFAEYARQTRGLFLLAETPRGAVAYSLAAISRSSTGLATLVSIAVLPEARRRGAASLLLRSTMRRLKLRGIARLTLVVRQTNLPARRFYERHGFALLRRAPAYYGPGRDGLLMRRDL